jgi:hypothetical protein
MKSLSPDQRQMFAPDGQEAIFDQDGKDQLSDLAAQATDEDRRAMFEIVR